jgi:hypothetical protein
MAMFFKAGIGVLCMLTIQSCDWISFQKPSVKAGYVNEVIIDYTVVDAYPLFAECQGLADNSARNICFENTFKEKVELSLKQEQFITTKIFTDTVYAKILVDASGKFSVEAIEMSDIATQALPQFDSIFKADINKMPLLLQSATKRGIPVNSRFKLPIIIRAKT